MKVLVTGAKGFIGKHMCATLLRSGHEVFEYDITNTQSDLEKYIAEADFVIHLAGINRPITLEEFYEGNTNFTKLLVDLIKEKRGNSLPVIMSSSIQAELDNDYGKSKLLAENYLFDSGLPVYVYRLANVFGRGARPNYNSACATFCDNIANNREIFIRDELFVVHYNYVDDVCDEFLKVVNGDKKGSKVVNSVKPVHDCSLGHLAELLFYFKKEIESERHLPIIKDEFELKLFKSFCWYLSDPDQRSFNKANDNRGSFEELYKSKKWGQISDNVSFPGIIKGGHYHTYKKEIFYTVIGHCEIKQRKIDSDEILVWDVRGEKPEPVEIKVGYTHSIQNIGDVDSHTIMWISEIYSDETPDTFRCEVIK